jgi:hypothetical protein
MDFQYHWESMYIQIYRQQNQLIMVQHVNEINPLYEHAYLPRTLQNTLWPDSTRTGTPGTCTEPASSTMFISRFAHLHDTSYIMQVQSLSWKLYITGDKDIRPHTIREHNERTSTEFNLVTA